MKEQLPFFNLSLSKVMAAEPDSFKRAKIKIVLTILVFTLIKALIVIPVAVHYMQYRQLFRVVAIVLLFLLLIKIILYKPATLNALSHIMMITGLSIIWSNVFIYAQYVNIVTIQMVFMVTLVSYYLLGGVQAALYTALAILPVIFSLFTQDTTIGHLNISTQELAAPGAKPIIFLNFVTFILSHYLYYRAFHQNLEEKEILNQQLQVNILEAKALAESRSVFLSTMSHELRTPLNGVIGMAGLLKDSALDEQKDNLNILEFSANNLLAVVNDILDYNKSELDKIELEAVPVNLSVLLQKICFGLEMKAAEKALSWKLELDERLKTLLVTTDPTRLTQIIYNLAGNAIKFTHDGMVDVKAAIISRHEDKIQVRFSVIDTGIGIALDRQEAVFHPFTQASSDTTRHYGGTGLGLAIVKRLLALFGSSVQLDSQPEKGSDFSFIIEFLLHKGEIPDVTNFKVDKAGMNGLKLLIVEDNRINVLLLEKLLSKWEIQTAVAVNGQEAVNKLLNDAFHGILMDLHMPIMDGYAATAAIRSFADPEKSKIPIIAMTASVSHNVHAKIKEVGMQDYLAKPFQSDQLYEKLQQIYAAI
jgi:signal transduction histidine kinase/ActR/RegA family two-component response regulator